LGVRRRKVAGEAGRQGGRVALCVSWWLVAGGWWVAREIR
jgi:hypothetical protein